MGTGGGRAVVLGAGVSGRAAARFLLSRGWAVDIHDDAPSAGLHPGTEGLQREGALLLAGGVALDPTRYDLAVLSPGISVHAPRVRALAEAGVEVTGEVELAARHLSAPVLAVTGTNGKTTVTELLGEILRAQGKRVFVGGNLGTPLVEAVGGDWDFLVAEVSSFQLETISRFRPRVAVLLNVTDDHFDRHGDLAGYARAKERVFENQGPGDAAVVNREDPVAWEAARRARSAVLPFSVSRILPVGAWLEGDDAVFLLPGHDGVRVPATSLQLPGRFNRGNALAACLAAAWVGVSPQGAWEAARGFSGRPHRLEPFLYWEGIRFVDDSKATNVGAVVAALDSVEGPVVLVAGGVDKGGDYSALAPPLTSRAREVVLVGAAAPQMADALAGGLAGRVPVGVFPDWPSAVRRAVAAARPGDTVLLSPACSSFDVFQDYAERGDTFQRLCREETARLTERSGDD
ncbi:MAG: UDP-N-acetylmuramoyl-L-alanine--D-glutamate ligase [Deferrisomatales bacterium]|nr:UDP-N-acetylmuramoyl-L-alanine--D-glutamate ligase [Deferrisomatales bacterium]